MKKSPSNEGYPQPTETERKTLNKCIGNWKECSELQQAILLIVIRGTQQPRWIAPKLGVSREDVVNSLDGIAGILVDANTKTIYFK